MRQPGASRAGHTAIDHGVEQLLEKLVAQGGQSRRLAVAALRPHELGGHSEPDQGGQVLGAGSVPALLPSAQDLRPHLQLGPDPERARARRAVDVIARERQEIDPHRVDGERHPPEGAHGVDVQGHARRAREPADLAERLQRPDLRTRGTDRNEGRLGAERTAQGVEHHAPLAVDGEGHDRGAPSLELPTRIGDGDVLDGRDDDPRAARAARAERHPSDGEVIGLGRARGEDHARGRAAAEARHLDARGLERDPRLRAERVRCRWIADAGLEERAHDGQHPRIDRSKPSVVEVDPFGRRVAGAHPTGSS